MEHAAQTQNTHTTHTQHTQSTAVAPFSAEKRKKKVLARVKERARVKRARVKEKRK